MTFHAAVIACACERSGGYYTAGLIGIIFRVLDVVVLLLLGTDVLVLGMLLLMSVRVRAVVLIRNNFFCRLSRSVLKCSSVKVTYFFSSSYLEVNAGFVSAGILIALEVAGGSC